MPYANSSETDFLKKAQKIVEENLSNELFGVSELANEMGISRSYLHRKVSLSTKVSVSKFIRQIRLKKAKELLRNTSSTVSEVAYNVGFSSVSYFSKCFHDYYGYSPGNERRDDEEKSPVIVENQKRNYKNMLIPVAILLPMAIITFVIVVLTTGGRSGPVKRIAVLPAANGEVRGVDTDIFGLIDLIRSGLMDLSTLDVVDRTMIEPYLENLKPTPEIGRKLNTLFVLEVNGEIEGREILLDVRLIESSTGLQVWEKIYQETSENILRLSTKVVRDLVKELNNDVKSEEKQKTTRPPTENLLALESYFKGMKQLSKAKLNYMCGYQDAKLKHYLDSALVSFEKAVSEDDKFSLAHAHITKIYHYKSLNERRSEYVEKIQYHSLKASLYDPNSVEVLIAQGYYFRKIGEYEDAILALERALEINPNSNEAVGLLSNIYGFHLRQADKFVVYAMKNDKLNVSLDSATNRTLNYVAATALSRIGFFKEANKYYLRSLDYKPDAFASVSGKALNMCFEGEEPAAQKYFASYYKKDTAWGLENYGYFCFLTRDFDEAYNCYKKQFKKFGDIRPGPYDRNFYSMCCLLYRMGQYKEALEYMKKFEDNIVQYTDARFENQLLCILYALKGENENALKHLREVSQTDLSTYWWIYRVEHSPVFDELRNEPEFKELTAVSKDRFWAMHKRMEKALKEERLL